MRNPNNNGSDEEEEWEVLSDVWTEADAEEAEEGTVEEHEINEEEERLVEPAAEQSHVEETPNTNEEEHEIVFEEEGALSAEDQSLLENDAVSMDENQLLLQDENASDNGNDDENEQDENKEDENKQDEQDDEKLTPGVRVLVDMGFSAKESEEALFYSDGDMNQAVSELVGEHQEWHKMNRARKDASLKMKHTALEVVESLHLKDAAKAVGQAVGNGAREIKKVYHDKDVPGKAKVAAHKAKLTARTVGREVKTFNEKYHVTETVATVGMVVAAAMLAKGNVRVATTTAAVAGSAYVAGEGMRSHRRDEIYE